MRIGRVSVSVLLLRLLVRKLKKCRKEVKFVIEFRTMLKMLKCKENLSFVETLFDVIFVESVFVLLIFLW